MTYILPSIFLFMLFVGLIAPLSFLTYLFFIFPVFGSMALLPPELAGGSSLTPGSFATLFFVIRALSSRSTFGEVGRSLIDFRRLGFLSLFLIVAVLGAYVLPRVFEGAIRVHTMRTGQLEFVAPSIANYTQAAYLILSTLTAATVAALARNTTFVNILPKAILAGAYAVIATGILDIVANYTGLSAILSYFRTANYVFMTENVVEGTRRIIGLMPEASSFGGMAASFCGLLLFLRPVFPPRLWQRRVPAAAWGCGLMALLSTSSTAYVIMAVILCLYALYSTHRIAPDGRVIKKTISKKVLAFIGAAIFGLLILIFDSDLLAHFAKLIDVLIFQKQSSNSYIDRMRSTEVAFDAFLESDGLGVGIGSARTSNFFVNVLASTGVLGAGLFIIFLWNIFRRHAPAAETRANVTIRATKLALIPMFIGAALAGTTPDFGSLVGLLFGLIAGLAQPPAAPGWVSPLMQMKIPADLKVRKKTAGTP